MIGSELALDEHLPAAQRWYIRLLGAPISGLRIRARRILPLIDGRYHRILDAGCGQGVFTFAIARRLPGSLITGVDIDEALLDRNRRISDRLQLHNCRFINDDITALTERDAYDLILSVDNLEHITDDEGVLRSFHEALAPGGEILLHVPGDRRRWLFFGWRENFAVEGHVRSGYAMYDILDKVTRAGLTVYEHYHTYGWLETVTNNLSYVITGAKMQRKGLYGVIFPLLLAVSWFGRNARPARGAGILIRARKETTVNG